MRRVGCGSNNRKPPLTLITSRSPRSPSAYVRVKRPGDRRSLSRSATRALDVLELFGAARHPLRAVDISNELGIHASTTNQLLKTMLDSGHLVFEARSKTYLPSPRLAEFSAWIMASYGADGRLRDLIDAVHLATGMVVTISAPNDLFMQVIDCAIPAGESGERGLSVSLFGSAIGSAYLATLEDAEALRLADRARVPAADIPAILGDLDQIRAAGFADGSTAGSHYWSMALALPMRGLRVPTVLGLAGMDNEVRERLGELHRIMRDAVERWSGEPLA